MASLRDLRRRIKSIKNTAQITKAMQMVASAKMRKAQMAAVAGRPYAQLMNEVLSAATAGAGEFSHPLMEVREGNRRAVILITTDKGLCGALNTNLLREAGRLEPGNTVFIAAGKKGAQWAARLKRELGAEFLYKDTPAFADARAISKFAQQMFLEGKVDRVDVLFTNFISTINQRPEQRSLLPIGRLTKLEAGVNGENTGVVLEASGREYQFEPAPAKLLGDLLPQYVNYQVYQYLLEAKASEHSARMVAMKNATDNAKGIIKDLSLEYNKLRQANITKELLEITSAAMAMGN
jgi:F-type H+-transporting ATPase subunit gamma